MEVLKNVTEALTKHKRKFIVTLVGNGLIFVLTAIDKVPGVEAITAIKVITIGFVMLEVVSKSKLLANGKN